MTLSQSKMTSWGSSIIRSRESIAQVPFMAVGSQISQCQQIPSIALRSSAVTSTGSTSISTSVWPLISNGATEQKDGDSQGPLNQSVLVGPLFSAVE